MSEMIDTKQIELHFEKANMAAEMVDRGRGFVLLGAITAGQELNSAKESVGHGRFTEWLNTHWNYSHSLANKYMRIANSERVTNLGEATSVREALALAMVAQEADASNATLSGKPADANADSEPAKSSPTIRKTRPDTRKTPESKKPPTQQVAPLIPEDPDDPADVHPDPVDEWFAGRTLEEIIAHWFRGNVPLKSMAKELRKLADKWDPPTKFRAPTVDEVATESAC